MLTRPMHRHVVRRAAEGALLALAILVLARPPARAESKSHPEFAKVVAADFRSWDHDGNGALSNDEVSRLVASPRVKGEQAAALAAIRRYQRQPEAKANISRAFLLAPEKHEPKGPKLGGNFLPFLEHIRSTPHKLFATAGAPTMSGMAQGPLGDCYFVATVGALVRLRRAEVRKMFHPQGDGSCEVVFGDGERVKVPPITDAQIALGSYTGREGLWLTTLEVADGSLRAGHRRTDAAALDIIHGGNTAHVIERLTGHKAERIGIRKRSGGHEPPTGSEVTALKAKVREVLKACEAERRVVTTSIGKSGVPPAMGHNHAYAILGLEGANVRVWNPWGAHNNHTPKGKPGLKAGYVTRDGQFSLPLDDFVHLFGEISFETSKKLERIPTD
jgi:hypothetical protein